MPRAHFTREEIAQALASPDPLLRRFAERHEAHRVQALRFSQEYNNTPKAKVSRKKYSKKLRSDPEKLKAYRQYHRDYQRTRAAKLKADLAELARLRAKAGENK